MKQKDFALIAIIVVIGGVMSFVLSNLLFGGSKSHSQTIDVVPTISASFPDVYHDANYTKYFNSKSLDPTKLITIGQGGSTDPFSATSTQ